MNTVAVDIGGTFTDLAALDPATGALRFAKSLTTPPEFRAGRARIAWPRPGSTSPRMAMLRHGTTVVINALLERKGARTALVTTEGFRDMLEIGRGNRPESFNLFYHRLPPLVPRDLRLEVPERIDARGAVRAHRWTEAALAGLADRLHRGAGSRRSPCACCTPGAIRRTKRRSAPICARHHDVLRLLLARDFARIPRIRTHLHRGAERLYRPERRHTTWTGSAPALATAGFAGQLVSDGIERRRAVRGGDAQPAAAAGGIRPGRRCRRRRGARRSAIGLDQLVAFDMGGTTAKAVLIEDGEAAVSPLYWVGGYERGYPVQAAVLDIVEVGAGGGSIAGDEPAWRAAGRPAQRRRRARDRPATAHGGTEPTVTDANLLLGRLDAARFLGGAMSLRRGSRGNRADRASPTKLDQDVARSGRRHPADRHADHGHCGAPRDDRARLRSARLRHGCVRRRRPAACRGGSARNRHAAGDHSAAARAISPPTACCSPISATTWSTPSPPRWTRLDQR